MHRINSSDSRCPAESKTTFSIGRICAGCVLASVCMIVLLVGCADSASDYASSKFDVATASEPSAKLALKHASPNNTFAGANEVATGGRSSLTPNESLPLNRKIIYQAQLEIVVEDFGPVETLITDLVKRHSGFIASAKLDRLQGERRKGTWVVRIPVDQYDQFLLAAGNIGVPASQNQTAQDVTEEYVDVEARIANQKKLEARIVELLDRPDDKLQHVIEVERELARVRENIERMEGRLRFLADQTALTTVTLSIREEKNYVPPQAPTFTSRISRSWNQSLVRCRTFFENVAVFAVANALAFAIFIIAAVIAIPILRRIYRLVFKQSE